MADSKPVDRVVPPNTGPMGMNADQAALIQTAVDRFGSTPFTIGMLCETAGVLADDCLDLARECHELGTLRCPVNDGGHVVYEVMPELVFRSTPTRR